MNLAGFSNISGDIRKAADSTLPFERSDSFAPKSESFDSFLSKAIDNTSIQHDDRSSSSKETRSDDNEKKKDYENKSDVKDASSVNSNASSETHTKKTAAEAGKENVDAAKQDVSALPVKPAADFISKHNGIDASKNSEVHASGIKADERAKKSPKTDNSISLNNILNHVKRNAAAKPADTGIKNTDSEKIDAADVKDSKKKTALIGKNNTLPIDEKPLNRDLNDKVLAEKISNAVKNLTAGSKSKTAAAVSDAKTVSAERTGAENTAKETVHTLTKDAFPSSPIAKETGENSQSSLMKNFSQHLTESSASSKTAPSGQVMNPFADKLDEIMAQAKVTVRDAKNAQLSIRLNPEHLGRMNVSFGLENGVLSAKFLVESAEAKESLMSNLNILKETLAGEGISLGGFQVDVRGEQNFKARENREDHPVHYTKIMGEEAETEYTAGQSVNLSGSINLIA